MLYQEMGDYRAALPLQHQALAIWKEVLGEKHSDYALSLNNLAALYREQGRYVDAEPLFQRSLAIRSMSLTPASS